MSADDETTYCRGDLDPTPNDLDVMCAAEHLNGYWYTWPVRHLADTDHVAGDGRLVLAVWPVTT